MKKYVLLMFTLTLICLIGILPVASAGTGKIAFHSSRDNGNWDIYVMNADGTGQTRLTTDADIEMDPDWSPDGSRIAYTNGTPGWDIWVMNADGTGQTQLTTDGASDLWPDWSPDGSKIAFMSDRDGDFEIFVMNADGSGQTPLTTNSFEDENPAWSPDGSRIAFATDRDGNFEIYVMNADGTNPVRLTNTPDNPLEVTDAEPAWSPDGSQIAFISTREAGSQQIYGMNADGTWQARLTSSPAGKFNPVWSPDGAWIAFDAFDTLNSNEIFVMDSHGLGTVALTNDPGYDANPDWWDSTRTAPLVTGITVPSSPVAVGTTVAPTGFFIDPDTADTHTATWTWGDGNSQTDPVPAGERVVSATHVYTEAGIYTIELVITDSQGRASAAFAAPCYVVVYDPAGGYVAGSGSIMSPPGAFLANPTLTGPATFGFMSRYSAGANKKGSSSTSPQGTTEFRFQAGGLTFRSSKLEWLVISGQKATFKGTGTVNRKGTYGFLLSAIDGQPDTFRIKIVDKSSGALIYDNKAGASDTADPTTAITSGSITITKP